LCFRTENDGLSVNSSQQGNGLEKLQSSLGCQRVYIPSGDHLDICMRFFDELSNASLEKMKDICLIIGKHDPFFRDTGKFFEDEFTLLREMDMVEKSHAQKNVKTLGLEGQIFLGISGDSQGVRAKACFFAGMVNHVEGIIHIDERSALACEKFRKPAVSTRQINGPSSMCVDPLEQLGQDVAFPCMDELLVQPAVPP